LLVAAAIITPFYLLYLDSVVRNQFEGKRWALPARVYAQPLELYADLKLSADQFVRELGWLGYRAADGQQPGTYERRGDTVTFTSRAFTFWDGPQPTRQVEAVFGGDRVVSLTDAEGEALTLTRLDPLLIGSIYPAQREDRQLVRLTDVPSRLVTTLIAIEDRKFYQHQGIDPRGIARAFVSNLRPGGSLQGGSTLTQQLVKNFYLSSERTLRRKVVEIAMALMLDRRYGKDEILEAYLNEIYLGQDRSRAVHGFGLASQFYFGRPIGELELPQIALLVGMVKGPSYYDPRRHPERALERRNVVLNELLRLGMINEQEHASAHAAPLGVLSKASASAVDFPAFLNLVHRELRADYREEDLRSEGLQIFTTLHPRTQRTAEQALALRLTHLEKQRRLPPDSLQGAVVVTSMEGGEVLALVGGRDARFEGFNRALDAERQIGSLMKPVVYLAALEQGRHTLISLLDDSPFVLKERGAPEWVPANYDKQFHGPVELRKALAESYNIPAVRLGQEIGLDNVLDLTKRLGVSRPLPPYLSTALGTANMTPFEVAQLYQTLGSGGFRAPLRAVRQVLTADGRPLQHYTIDVEQVVDPAPVYLLTTALQGVVREGTARGLSLYMPPEANVAGKTGTTNDLRDNWFAGYTGDKVAVVWVGRDDNKPANLTGASGAMTVWGEMMSKLDYEPLTPTPPDNVEQMWIDPTTRLRAEEGCPGAVSVPFIVGTAPRDNAPCVSRSPVQAVKGWLKRWFE
jgi:penicillin-binding protein 1B